MIKVIIHNKLKRVNYNPKKKKDQDSCLWLFLDWLKVSFVLTGAHFEKR